MNAIALPVPQPLIGSDILDALRGFGIRLSNVFTNAGTSIAVKRIIQTGTAGKFIGWGTGTTAAAVTDTALTTEAAPTTAGGRTTGTESQVTTTVTGDTYQVTGTVTATLAGPTAITEEGLFDAATAGNMLLHSVFAAVNQLVGDSILFTNQLKLIAN